MAGYFDLFERMLDCVLLLDPDTYAVVDANSAAERTLGRPREELLGKDFFTLLHGTGREEMAKAFRISKRRYHPYVLTLDWQTGQQMEMAICTLQLNGDNVSGAHDGVEGERQAIQIIAKDVTQQLANERKISAFVDELQALNQKLEALAVTDEKTQLPNFRSFKNQLALEHERSSRYGSAYAIVFMDVDNFKHYNDRNGHPAGDALLSELAAILREACRNTDLPARFGGEEFAVLCPETTGEAALILAERIRAKVAAYPFAHASHQPLGHASVSIGVASFPDNGITAEQVLEAADQGVYAAKHAGRDRIVLSKTSVPAAAKAS